MNTTATWSTEPPAWATETYEHDPAGSELERSHSRSFGIFEAMVVERQAPDGSVTVTPLDLEVGSTSWEGPLSELVSDFEQVEREVGELLAFLRELARTSTSTDPKYLRLTP